MMLARRAQLERLFELAREGGRALIGPTVRDGAIVFAEIERVEQLPIGWRDVQSPGKYRLERRSDDAAFGHVVGPNSAKELFFAPSETLYRAERRPDGKLGFTAHKTPPTAKALIGVRACDLAAMRVQDRVFERSQFRDPQYSARRADTVVIGVHCTEPGSLCFCSSMGTGPRVAEGADLALAERGDELLVDALSPRGEALLAQLEATEASASDHAWLDAAMDASRARMGTAVDVRDLHERLYANLDHPRFAEVASRCLSCSSCTSVCPTCFCSNTVERSDLDGAASSRVREWDSCFTREHSTLHGHAVREQTSERYRQWITHKFGAWVAQFDSSGCTGCGRCIAWCPAQIDVREELAALTNNDRRTPLPSARSCDASQDETLVPRVAEVVSVARESGDVVTLRLRAEGFESFAPGQFSQLSLPAIGEAPISISGRDGAEVEHTIRAVGALTDALCKLEPGEQLGVRGPYGRGWPLDELAGGPVVVVAGGIGLAPLREALRRMIADPARFTDLRLFYGARTPDDLLYAREMLGWVDRPGFQLYATVDRASATWRGHVGVVTRLLKRETVGDRARAIICGPETMMRFTVDALARAGVPHDRVWVTMERHMKCATGLCGRCQLGPYFVCKDGPVFRFDEVASLFGRQGI
jgi:NAD(P)H-flavin reductase/formate hydrogenlyase subunit 6/NADH:ubiquinone oxidoreductase subunit I